VIELQTKLGREEDWNTVATMDRGRLKEEMDRKI